MNGRSRVPLPPARTIACIAIASVLEIRDPIGSVSRVRSPTAAEDAAGPTAVGVGDLLEQRDEPSQVDVERLRPAEPPGPLGHRPAVVVVGEPVEGVGQRGRASSGSGTTKPSRPSVMTSPAPLQAVVITGRPQASASKTTSEQGS